MYIKRTLETKITKYLKTPEIIAVTGARQVGKRHSYSKFIKVWTILFLLPLKMSHTASCSIRIFRHLSNFISNLTNIYLLMNFNTQTTADSN